MTQRAKFYSWIALTAAILLASCGDSNNNCADQGCSECLASSIGSARPDADKSTITASPTNGIPADGTTKSTITVTVRDVANGLLANYDVRLNVTGTNNLATPLPEDIQSSDSNGVATWVLASTTAETKVVSADVIYSPPCGCGPCSVTKAETTLSQTASIESVSP